MKQILKHNELKMTFNLNDITRCEVVVFNQH